ncbi:MAG: NAD(P) transhydrogenase subunit beta [Firmicutes bacterium ADurb.Bin506]|nr:MAG: NAD(P) transhydrogenase subunit beta [Firmicutes bacterium ADurb.Bin506]
MNWKEAIVLGLSLADILGFLCVIGTVWGIKMMSSPATAVRGNLLGAVSMAVAIIITLVSENIIGQGLLWAGMAVGTAIGYWSALKVTMLQMPQMVALLNGLGGGSSALVSLLTLLAGGSASVASVTGLNMGLIVGGVTLSGSIVAGAKLHGLMSSRPVVFEGQRTLNNAVLAVTAVLGALSLMMGTGTLFVLAMLTLIGSLVYGVLFAIRVGGADMPITVSLLNSFSGVAASISGFAISNPLLISIGAVVGASGLILTQIMCRAMNRSLGQVLSGATTVLKPAHATDKSTASAPVRSRGAEVSSASTAPTASAGSASPAVPAHIQAARNARKVIVVPGYGMALAQAQSDVKALIDMFDSRGADVKVGVHPVAGRMPGHMNVLLAEVDVAYDKLYEMDDINPEFADADLVVVVGANDVINPAANTAEGTPIYGMPILNVAEAKHIVICNYDTRPGYAGVENPLYQPSSKVTLLLGDAAMTLKKLLADIAAGDGAGAAAGIAPTDGQAVSAAPTATTSTSTVGYVDIVKQARKVIVVPGYGMALAQAQADVKKLMDMLEQNGADVKVGIHPVAGRMPGHMNVLLAEVDVAYDKLYEMDDINPEFADADLALVVGANDVINPAANTAEGTPIYGMPILNVAEAKHVVICNYDTKPGYAGVDNPLYKPSSKVTLLLGDAAVTVKQLMADLSTR